MVYKIKSILAFVFLAFVSGTSFAQMQYYESEAEEDDDIIEFAFITDTHKYGPTADERKADLNIKAFVRYCQEHPHLLFAAHGGDMMNSYDTNHEQALWSLEQSQRDFTGIPQPLFVSKGNHDCNGKSGNNQIITDREYYDLFSPLSPTNPLGKGAQVVVDSLNPYGNYYYCDFPVQRLRVIMLNDYDRDSLEVYGYHGQQMKWLCEQALNFENKALPSTWSFLIIGHFFSANLFENAISRLMHAYVKGEDFQDTDSGVSYGAPYHRMLRAQCIGLLCGHQHEDFYSNKHGYNIINVTRGFATGSEVGNDDICFDHFIIDRRSRTIRENRIGRGRNRQYSYEPPSPLSPRLAFPEADGMGRITYGGHGGRLLRVTNLNDDGEGSLRWAVQQTGSRYIVFDVSGTIELKRPLVIGSDYITIAGQSAPGNGICIKGPISITSSDVVLRYLRIRPGTRTDRSWPADAISDGRWGQRNILLDHLSVSWAEGSCIAIRHAQNVTVQHCLLSQSLYNVIPDNGKSEAPGLLAGGIMSTYYRNVIAHHTNAIQFPNKEGENRWPHVIRNIIYNWSDHAMWGGNQQGEITIEENRFIPGPATPEGAKILDVAEDGSARYYLAWNTYAGHESSRNSAEWVNDSPGVPYEPLNPDQTLRRQMTYMARPTYGDFTQTCLTQAAFHYKPIAGWVDESLLERQLIYDAGCSYRRDAYDSLIVESLRNRTAPKFTNSQIRGQENGIISDPKPLEHLAKLPVKHFAPKYSNHEDYLDRIVAQKRSIVILYDNDVMCSVENYSKLTGYRDAIEGDTAIVGIVSSGDFLSGGIFGSISKGRFITQVMRAVGYDAVHMGNYEWAYDPDQTRSLVNEYLGPIATSCNTYQVGSKEPYYAPYVMKNYGDTRIAFVGVTSPNVLFSQHEQVVNDDGKPLFHFAADTLYQHVQHTVDDARRHGAQYVVILTSLGNGNENDPHTSEELIRRTRHIDAVIDSHVRKELNTLVANLDGKQIPLTRNADDFQSFGKLVIAPDGVITSEIIPFTQLQFKNPGVSAMLDSIRHTFDSYTSVEIAVADTIIDSYGPNGYHRRSESPLGDLVADALRAVAHTQLSLINAGAIRKRLPDGPITRSNCLQVLPFNSDIYTIQITGMQLSRALIEMARLAPNNVGTFFQVSGMKYILVEGRGIEKLQILNPDTGLYERYDPLATYSLVTTRYVLEDPLYKGAFDECPRKLLEGHKEPDPLMIYLEQHLGGHITNQHGRTQGRITVISKDGKSNNERNRRL